MNPNPAQARRGKSLRFRRILFPNALAVGMIVSAISLNLVGHDNFIQTDRVLLVPLGKIVWSYGWPLRWMEKDVEDIEFKGYGKDHEFRTRWGIHHSPYDWVNGKYKVSYPNLLIDFLAIIALLVGSLWSEYRSILVKRLKRSPIAILLCCTAIGWRFFGASAYFVDPIEFILLRGMEFASSLMLLAITIEIAIKCLAKTRFLHRVSLPPNAPGTTN